MTSKFDFVLLAAGEGTRLYPITASTPKCMARVLEKPLIEWLIEAVKPYAKSITVVVGYKKEHFFEHLDGKGKKYANVSLIEQAERRGTAHALLQAESKVKGDFFVVNADTFFGPDLFARAVAAAEKGPVAVGKKVEVGAFNYGVLEAKQGKLARVVEKPLGVQAGLIAIGTYFLPVDFFAQLKKVGLSKRGEYELVDAVNTYAAKKPVQVLEYDGFWTDVSTYWNYLDANRYALEAYLQPKIEGEVEDGVVLKNARLYAGKGAVVKAGTRIEGLVYIGENCTIGPHAFLRNGVVIERDCHVGTSEIKASVLLRESNVPHVSYVGDSVLCEDVNIGGGTVIANLRFDDKNVKVNINGRIFDSGRRKLGAAVGQGTRVGVNAAINCGAIVPPNSRILPGSFYK